MRKGTGNEKGMKGKGWKGREGKERKAKKGKEGKERREEKRKDEKEKRHNGSVQREMSQPSLSLNCAPRWLLPSAWT